VAFVLVGENQKLNVIYTGSEPLPDTFRDGAQALAEGKMGPDGAFHAAKIQAKCASKYAPKPGELYKPGGEKPAEAPQKISLNSNKQGM
jgi:cytochrome c-type biogenesis protein CcmE